MFAAVRSGKRPNLAAFIAGVSTVFSIMSINLYNWHIQKFWQEIGSKWTAYDAVHVAR
jgi:hypothetical protein